MRRDLVLVVVVAVVATAMSAAPVRADTYNLPVQWFVPVGGNNTTVLPPPPDEIIGPTQFGVFTGFFYRVAWTSVTFVDRSQSGIPIVSWSWSFGDGATSTVQNPTHTYAPHSINQLYNVTLRSCTAQRCASTTQTVSVVNWTVLSSLVLFMAFMFLVLTVASRRWKRGRRKK